MQDKPTGELVLAEVAAALRAGVAPGFQQHVAANAVALALRERELAGFSHNAEHERLTALLGRADSLEALNAALAGAIRDGAIEAADPGLIRHLVMTTVEKMAVDQPGYPAFRAWRAACESKR
jgi:hypothetical protein